ncbi:MAG: PilZ domain-containing protein [Gammaproteobacteria bacterium]|nr:PilZ domain-containing protein [Gammaproteobacteria bacterium]
MYDSSVREKRNYFRIQLNCPVKLWKTESAARFSGVCINMSIKGILIELDQPVRQGDKLHILIEPGLDISPPLTGIVDVLRVERDCLRNRYKIAGTLETEVVV